jgi:hypothetical protein
MNYKTSTVSNKRRKTKGWNDCLDALIDGAGAGPTLPGVKKPAAMNFGFTLAGVLALLVLPARADTFASGANTFTIDFVNIGNAANADDAGAGGGSFTPHGGVGYNYRMGTYEISQDAITKATASGLLNVTAGAYTGVGPAGSMTWYEAAAFVNYLNTSTGHQAAYQINAGVTALTLWSSALAWQLDGENLYRHKDAFYFLPSEDEWYKAAYHKNDGVTANYWTTRRGATAPRRRWRAAREPGRRFTAATSAPRM